MINLPQWQFEQDETREWRWAYITQNVRAVSVNSFPDRADCIASAIQTAGADLASAKATLLSAR